MSQPAKAQEPSMEEILASIRRIIADDDATKTTKPPEPAPPKPAPVAAAPRPAPPPPPARVAPPPPPAPPPRPAPPAALDQDAVDKVMAAPEPPAGDDILDLTESMAMQGEPAAAAPEFRTIDGESDIVFSDQPPEPAPRAVEPPRSYSQPSVSATDRSIISQSTAAAVDSAFNSLANTVLGQNARTLEDLVKEMLRPMLKGWLDDNLPGLVERIVRAEIERVSRGRQ